MSTCSPRFEIGQRFMSSGRHPVVCTVTDILTTRNAAGEVVKLRYVAEHLFMGQVVEDIDVCESSIAMRAIDGTD